MHSPARCAAVTLGPVCYFGRSEQNRNTWEQMISHFTNKVYVNGIAANCSLGELAPLVGHNAFLRWSIIRDVAPWDEKSQSRKIWSEETVSEDFELFMRLAQIKKFGRWVG
jgi:hypothetical protein